MVRRPGNRSGFALCPRLPPSVSQGMLRKVAGYVLHISCHLLGSSSCRPEYMPCMPGTAVMVWLTSRTIGAAWPLASVGSKPALIGNSCCGRQIVITPHILTPRRYIRHIRW